MTAVSVVLPTRDRRAWLRLALATVLWQEEVTVEAIVVDDGSVDGTAETVEGLGDSRIRLLRHDRPRGVGVSRNHGADEASHPWVAFLDDDDLWAPDKLRLQIDAARRNERDWAYAGSVNVGEDLTILGGTPPPDAGALANAIFRYNALPGGGSNVVVRRDTLVAAGPFDTRLYNTEDWEMWIRLTKLGPPADVAEPLVAYRVHRTNASLDVAQILAGVALIERTHHLEIDRGILHRWIAESSLREGKRADALKHMTIAARHGQLGGVVGDLGRIARRRLASATRRSDHGSRPHADWTAPAERWLDRVREIEESNRAG
jgi:glycosyltransferase involved in cell wall biosynthesis